MSMERDQREFDRYLEFQRAQRNSRVETLGGLATVLFLSTIDLGITEVGNPVARVEASAVDHAPETTAPIEVSDIRIARQHRLAEFATDAAELGYMRAA